MDNIRQLKVMFNKSGGNAGKGAYSPKISLPKVWLDEMGVTLDDREVKVTFEDKKIIIEKK